ncbi:MAG: sulfatase-like hydrolase/transferase [Treponema sp.]|nr:sulfatase-like hydrolase/transferase [Treponema sp.]
MAVKEAAQKKPNILCIMSDEHTWNILGCYGNSTVKTPNLDKLAGDGVLFTDCYTPSPLCVPARLAFTAGQYISRCKGWDNESELASNDYPSLFRILNNEGYECVLGGKMHYAADRRYGFTKDLYPGFNKDKKTLKRHVRVNPDSEEYAGMKDILSPRFKNFKVADEDPHLDHDIKVTNLCGDYIKNHKKDDKPFFLLAGYIAPHFPFVVPHKFDVYKDKVPMPVIPDGFLESLPLHYKVLRRAFQTEKVPDEIIKRGRELYYGYVAWMDDQIGRLLQTLKNSESGDDTVVIYTTDHGENLGEHGMWWKNNMYDSAARIPLIVSFPDKYSAGKRINKVCGLLDLVPTITEICGGKIPGDWDGDSLLGLIKNEASAWRDFAVSEYYAHNIAAGHCMIRRGKYKYVYLDSINDKHGAEKQLFDLEADPQEFNNLAGDLRYAPLIKELHALLVKSLGRDPEDIEAEVRESLN